MSAVEILDLRLSYNQQPLFAGFNFVLPKGKWTTLLGASDIGKSTLVRAIAGLENHAITEGEIVLSPTQQISYMAQQDALYPWLSDTIYVLKNQPARLSEPIELSSAPPRQLGQQDLWLLQEQLLTQLIEGQHEN
ncbi:ATP-binding cassette domain-containing protein [Pasteurella multocida subsp. multocida]|uniref:ATP-binding cassette domain-containing protein n=1 Tax=Pasteurella multocida TaxID=747 RepID=A0A9X3UQD2_PASMD|nr:ATP-binding cassette domain-containing protein [Pasteurella multocida]MBF6980248.1 ATP-binding cassette domain-containing protein [Pasteurella multocida]MDA5610295.1 ATP-binding cassette domain-containing protein [Pasteurella multocida]MDA5613846.1 ATP-binding cassette domain-containing protein [Pasteurella multocida]MDA5617687.1 ATP-binding cassette domain-containing protein [Pasteurella multocida subsp. multocida]MDA5620107.1 ATP-binding cassette domain-containing protein [Pasteurella mul